MNRQVIELNYYQILEIDVQATVKQIRSAFRQKAKKLHPDTVGAHSPKSDSDNDHRMRLLINAYHTLFNTDLRRNYDLTHNIDAHKFNFSFRDFLRNRVGDYKSLARLVFYELLHDRPEEAIELYERNFNDELDASINRGSVRKRLSFYFSYNDYMDCLFLLAEAYEKEQQYLKAICFYRNIARLESNKAIFGHFFDEVRDALKRIVRTWEKRARVQHIIRFVPSLLDIHSLRRDRLFFEKKIACGQEFCNERLHTVHQKGAEAASVEQQGYLHEVRA